MSQSLLRTRVLPWLLTALYGASLGVEGLHTLAELHGPRVASVLALPSAGGDLGPSDEDVHDAGSCALCAVASQAVVVASRAGLAHEVAATPTTAPAAPLRPLRDRLAAARPRAPPRVG